MNRSRAAPAFFNAIPSRLPLPGGFGLVFLYAFALEPVLPGTGLVKGALFSFLLWLVAGLVVMLLLGKELSACGSCP